MINIEIKPSGKNYKYYQNKVNKAYNEIELLFKKEGFLLSEKPIDKLIIFTNLETAKEILSETFSIDKDKIPDTVGGTPYKKTLFMVDQFLIKKLFDKLYPEYSWDKDLEFYKTLKHEITHMFHEAIAIKYGNSSEAMGPLWFFEGLAVECADQFVFTKLEEELTFKQLKQLIKNSEEKGGSYINYRRIFLKLKKYYTISELLKAAFNIDNLNNLINKMNYI